jgi:O-antigen/teichoic acid export membrane protein
MELAKKTAKNSVYNTVSFLWPLALAFFTTPFMVGKLGQEYYGILALITSFVGFFGLLDFGVAPSIVKYVAELSTKGNYRGLSKIFSAATIFYVIVGILGAILIATIAPYYIQSTLKSTNVSFNLVYKLFLIAGLGFFINMLLSAFSAIPNALQRFDITSKVGLVTSTVSALGNVTLLFLGFGITSIVIFTLVIATVNLLVYAVINKKLIPNISLFTAPDRESFKVIFQFGGFAFLATISGLIISQLDRLILGSFLGPAAVTYYVIPGNLTVKILNLVNAICSIIFPLSAALIAKKATKDLHKLYKRSFRLVIYLLLFICVPALFFANKFLLYWLGQDFATNSTVVFVVLILTYAISTFHVVPFLLAFGANKPKYSAMYALITAVLNVILMWLLIPRFGINGAAYAYLIAVAIPTPLFVMFVQRKLLDRSEMHGYWRGILVPSAILGVMLVVLSYIASIFVNSILVMALMFATIVLLVGFLAIKFKLFSHEDLDLLGSIARKLGLKLKISRGES